MNEEIEFIYFTDPMCSWCYGFGPELAKLRGAMNEYTFSVVQGGLRPDETQPTPEKMSKEIAHHWEQVNRASGLPFDFTFFEKHENFVYNTSPACKAVVVAGRMDGEKVLDYQHELQSRFYAKGEDPTQMQTFVDAAGAVGLDEQTFQDIYEMPEAEEALRDNFRISRQFGVNAYPTLVMRIEDKFVLVAQGFLGFQDLKDRAEYIIANRDQVGQPQAQA